MKHTPPANVNYAAQVVRINNIIDLGLKTLVGIPVLGHNALTQKGKEVGDLVIAFTAETQLTQEYAGKNDLFRHAELNSTPDVTGYLEDNGRIKAIRLGGQPSNALLMPLDSVAYTGINPAELKEGDVFDTLNGHKICQKYLVVRKGSGLGGAQSFKAIDSRIDQFYFAKHIDTPNYFRAKSQFKDGQETVITQKLHGTSWRGAHIPVERKLSRSERFLRWLGWRIETTEHTVVFGSRNQVMDVNNPAGYFGTDIWSEYGKRIADLIPEGYEIYGELIGWTPAGAPIQRGYTYDLPQAKAELYVYRVETINRRGVRAELSWDAVKHFCLQRGLKWVPELFRVDAEDALEHLAAVHDANFHDQWTNNPHSNLFNEEPLRLSDPKSVDEGVVLRQEGLVPVILKAKSQKFLEYETKQLDKGEEDIEAAA